MKLSLCMIVKNEEEFLPKCLASVQNIVDEIIIVDTGSTDTTLEIAQSFNCSVYKFPWQGNFSLARNFSLEHAKGDWILFLDADEQLAPNQKEEIQRAVKQNVEGIQIQLINYFSSKKYDYSTDLVCRLFRNRPAYRFSGTVHEIIADSIIKHNPSAKICNCPQIKIYHYGYMPSVITERKKSARNLNILRTQKFQIDDPFQFYITGCEHFQNADYKTALNYFNSILPTQSTDLGYKSDLLVKVILCHKELNQFSQALQLLKEAQELFPSFTDLYYLAGLIEWELKNYKLALSSLSKCISIGDAPPEFSTINGVGSFRTFFSRGLIWEDQLCFNNALNEYLLALQSNGEFTEPITQILKLFKDWFTIQEGIKFLKNYLDFSSPMLNLFMAQELIKLDEFEDAFHFLKPYQKDVPSSLDEYANYLLGKVFFYLKEPLLSKMYFSKLPYNSKYSKRSSYFIFAINCYQGKFQDNLSLIDQLEERAFDQKGDFLTLLNNALYDSVLKKEVQLKIEDFVSLNNYSPLLKILFGLASLFIRTNGYHYFTIVNNVMSFIITKYSLESKEFNLQLGNLLFSHGYKEEGFNFLNQALMQENCNFDSLHNLHKYYLSKKSFLKAEQIKSLTFARFNSPRAYAKFSRNVEEQRKFYQHYHTFDLLT